MATKPTKAEPAAPPPDPDPQAPVAGVMLTSVRDGHRELVKGQHTVEPREQAARWFLMEWFQPAQGVVFTKAELVTAGRWCVEFHDVARMNRGTPPEKYWNVPARARFVARLEAITRPAGPEGEAA